MTIDAKSHGFYLDKILQFLEAATRENLETIFFDVEAKTTLFCPHCMDGHCDGDHCDGSDKKPEKCCKPRYDKNNRLIKPHKCNYYDVEFEYCFSLMPNCQRFEFNNGKDALIWIQDFIKRKKIINDNSSQFRINANNRMQPQLACLKEMEND